LVAFVRFKPDVDTGTDKITLNSLASGVVPFLVEISNPALGADLN
jgi:hypothetical protein